MHGRSGALYSEVILNIGMLTLSTTMRNSEEELTPVLDSRMISRLF